jgi:hypothetical protein
VAATTPTKSRKENEKIRTVQRRRTAGRGTLVAGCLQQPLPAMPTHAIASAGGPTTPVPSAMGSGILMMASGGGAATSPTAQQHSSSAGEDDCGGGDSISRGLAFGPSSFVKPGAAKSPPLADVLAAHPALAGYAPVFAEAEIDAALAMEMTTADFRALLPATAPFGHALKIRQVLRDAATDAAQGSARIPTHPAWRCHGTIIARGVLEGDLRSSTVMLLEFALITASLLLGVTSPYLPRQISMFLAYCLFVSDFAPVVLAAVADERTCTQVLAECAAELCGRQSMHNPSVD